jgi:hypothetical protein
MTSEVGGPVTPPLSWREQLRSGPFLILVAVLLMLLVVGTRDFVKGDTWFNLVAGREVAESGIIHSDRTTALGWGTPVVDVQWLAHLVFFAVADHVGLTGLVVIGAAWIAGCFVLGGAIALRTGATPGRVLLASLLAFTAVGSALVLRAQTLVYPMFVLFPAVLWLDVRAPRARTWWLVPVAVLWANLHGSVLLAPIFGGALLAARALDALRKGQPIEWRLVARDGGLTLAFLASIVVTPYGMDVWPYYAQTAGNPLFRQYVSEWWPLWTSPQLTHIALLLIITGVIARSWREAESFPLLVLVGLSVMQVTSIRHVTPLALACLVLLPHLLDQALGRALPMEFPEFTPRLATRTLLVSLAGFGIGVPFGARKVVATPGGDSLEARLAAEPVQHCMLVDEQQADRLMWYFPQLTGHLTHSVRMEAIPSWFMARMGPAYAAPSKPASRDLLRRYPIVAFDGRINGKVVEALKGDAQFERVGQAGSLHVFRNRRVRAMTTKACRSPA